MNKEMLLVALTDATTNLREANALIAELPTKDKITAHIEMAKAYALTSIAVALSSGVEQAPETAAETKKTKGGKKDSKDKATEPSNTDVKQPEAETTTPAEAATPAQQDGPIEAPATADAPAPTEEPLIKVVNDVFIQFTRPVIGEDGYDYSTWFMSYVNAVDDKGNSVVGVNWANQFVAAFSQGKRNTVEDLNDDSIMAFIKFVIDSINLANQDK